MTCPCCGSLLVQFGHGWKCPLCGTVVGLSEHKAVPKKVADRCPRCNESSPKGKLCKFCALELVQVSETPGRLV